MDKENRSSFSGKLGFVLAAAGASVGLGNIWRFPYLAAQYGGGIFLLVYIILALTFGYTMIMAETAIGRMTKKSPVSAFGKFSSNRLVRAGGWINAIIPILIVPYYSTIGGWVIKYLAEYLQGNAEALSKDSYFSDFITNGYEVELWFVVFAALVLLVVFLGVENGIERVSKIMMPLLLVLALVIVVYVLTMPGALEGVRYFLIPDLKNFSWMTVVTAMGQMFYSLSIAMGILITFGSYMKDDVSIENATENVELFDTGIAVMAGLMIIPAVFAFSGGNSEAINGGPSLMFVTIPKVLSSIGFPTVGGVVFFVLVLFAALTSAIALLESAVSTLVDEAGCGRRRAIIMIGISTLVLGTLSSMGYGPLSFIKILKMPFLDFADFLTNSVMMPVAALAICYVVTRHIGVDAIVEEVEKNGCSFKRKKVFNVMIRYLSPIFLVIILLSSVANAFGIIEM